MIDEVNFPPGWLAKDVALARRRAVELGMEKLEGIEIMSDKPTARDVIERALTTSLRSPDARTVAADLILSALNSAGLEVRKTRPMPSADEARREANMLMASEAYARRDHPDHVETLDRVTRLFNVVFDAAPPKVK